jgi:hypothetical protein
LLSISTVASLAFVITSTLAISNKDDMDTSQSDKQVLRAAGLVKILFTSDLVSVHNVSLERWAVSMDTVVCL